jgi:hypothetical protein
MRTLIATVSLCLLSTTALAQQIPGMATMDRFDEQSKFAASLTYVGLDADDVTGIRFDLFGQHLTPRGFGGYAALPISYIDSDADSETGIGNIEVGGLYVIPGSAPVVLRGGLTLPTADSDNFGANLLGILARFNDAVQHSPDVTWLRLSASPLMRSGTGFFKADIGLDIPVAEDDGIDADALVRVNFGGGVETGGIALMGELVNLATLEDDVDNRWVSLIGFTARYMAGGQVQPSISFQLPLDDSIEEVVDFNVIVGLEYVLPTRVESR